MTPQKVSGGVNGKKNGAGAGKILFKACHKNGLVNVLKTIVPKHGF